MMPASRAAETWLLGDLLAGVPGGNDLPDVEIDNLCMDSREVGPGSLFLACDGLRSHGMDHVAEAIERGVACVAAEPSVHWSAQRAAAAMARCRVPLIVVPGLGRKVSRIASRFYGEPGSNLKIVGVTGTNGKTTVSQFLAQALQPDWRCGVIGTLGHGFPDQLRMGTHTTPDPIGVQATLHRLRAADATAVAMEVSSHALEQHRVAAVPFDTAVFTNLSRDHLDYHGDMQTYGQAKSKLFRFENLRLIVANADDELGQTLLRQVSTGVKTVAVGTSANANTFADHYVRTRGIKIRDDSLAFDFDSTWGSGHVDTQLLGRFNVENLGLVLGVLLAWQVPPELAVKRLAGLSQIAGRMERFGGQGQPLVVVDFAHTPDALDKVLHALREHTQGELWCVFGCGGDRDRGKRPQMGAVADRLADRVILTDDNPRGENGGQIIAQIRAAMTATHKVHVEPNRAEAIRRAIATARPGDVVLIAGKGHEDYQLVGDLRLPFSDAEQVARSLAGQGE